MAKNPISATDLKGIFSLVGRRKTKAFAYGFFFTFFACTAYIAFSPSLASSPSWFSTFLSSSSPSSYRSHLDSFLATASSYGSQFFSSLLPNSTTSTTTTTTTNSNTNTTITITNATATTNTSANTTTNTSANTSTNTSANTITNTSANTSTNTSESSSPKWNIETMMSCNLFHGKWVREDSYPMYSPGSCPYVGESFDCFGNGRPDQSYTKLRWQPHGCYIPRFNATDMLERLRGKRLAFVGDSLNRNMWESLVCMLMNSIDDKTRVFEVSAKHQLKTDTSFSVVFKDYNCTVEFFRSVFLVQEWEMVDTSGNEKETLRLDMIAKSSSRYKDADIIVFNTGHWWTHEKTSKGKDYYQEGNHVYGQLNVVEAFHKALETWARWVDKNIDRRKTLVFFRGYSSSHFKGGRWNSGGQCDGETEPIKNETYLAPYPPKMDVLESVLREMETPVVYFNITRMTDYRKDAHPSIYRKPNLTEEEMRGPSRVQDCSHWCLPGVPDSWNDLLYSLLLINQHRTQ